MPVKVTLADVKACTPDDAAARIDAVLHDVLMERAITLATIELDVEQACRSAICKALRRYLPPEDVAARDDAELAVEKACGPFKLRSVVKQGIKHM